MVAKRSATSGDTGSHQLGLHQGEALWALAGTYDTLLLTIVEAAQNAVDADATRIFVGIDVQQELVVVADNGSGVDEEKFQLALRSIGKTVKQDPKRIQLGRFGRGLIAPLDKCGLYEIFSQPIGLSSVNHWTFAPDVLREQEVLQGIPFRRRKLLPNPPRQFAAAYSAAADPAKPWRTIAKVTRVTDDKSVSRVNLDELRRRTLSNIGQGMRRNGVVMHVAMYDERGKLTTTEISPAAYTGEPLEVVEIHREDCGTVRFELYRAARSHGMRRGQVVVQKAGDPCAITWQDFVLQATGTGVFKAFPDLRESFDTVGSGYFEGRIEIEDVKLHAERTKFVRTDALIGAYVAVDEWFKDHGRSHYEIEHEARRDERYRELGGKALDYVLQRLLDDAFLGDLLQLMELLPVKLLDQGDATSIGLEDEQPPKEPGQPRRKRVVVGPQNRRKREKPDRDPRPTEPEETPGQFALQFAYEVLPDSDRLFEFDFKTGIITFNVGHPTWTKVDETDGKHTARHDRQLIELQQWLAFKILRLLARHPNSYDFESARSAMIDDEVGPYVAMFIVQ